VEGRKDDRGEASGIEVKPELLVLGEVFRQSRGILVLRAATMPSLGERVYSGDGRTVGVASDVFGRIDSFYVAVRLTDSGATLRVGEKLYIKRYGLWEERSR